MMRLSNHLVSFIKQPLYPFVTVSNFSLMLSYLITLQSLTYPEESLLYFSGIILNIGLLVSELRFKSLVLKSQPKGRRRGKDLATPGLVF